MTQKISYNADGELRLEDDVVTVSKKIVDLLNRTGWNSADETWTYASADDPTFTFTIAAFDATAKYWAGMKIKLTDTGTQFGIITKVVFDDPGSTITIYMGTDYSLSGAAITLPYYSTMKAPHGFPLDPIKWTVEVTDTTARQQAAPTQNTWYNLGSITISIPIGAWAVNYKVAIRVTDNATATYVGGNVTLSTANDSESNADFTTWMMFLTSTSDNKNVAQTIYNEVPLNIASKTSYYINTKTSYAGIADMYNANDQAKLIIRAVCAYL